ncbi:Folylpolyglutamate synthetase [Dipsacomyces acuminosporus]|nr:Folylpolyglutamate synthetase [Dipsacomyces acuminosporus]
MEVGVGGEYDSTNVIRQPVVCGIASLGIDHQGSLGNTIEEIAWHKGGIIKDGVPVFTVEQPDEAMGVLRKRADGHKAQLSVVRPLDTEGLGVKLGIAGEHQAINAALAVELCREWAKRVGISDQIADNASTDGLEPWIKRGLELASWPGRSQTFSTAEFPGIAWHVDGAHTTESTAACAKWFAAQQSSSNSDTKCVLLFNAAHGRQSRPLLQTLWSSLGEQCSAQFIDAVFCPNLTARADSVNHTVENDVELKPQKEAAQVWTELAGSQSSTKVLPTINDAVAYIQATHPSASVLATGSLHLVGGVLDVAKGSI